MSNRQFHWLTIGLAVVASVAGGVLIGEQASADFDPYYARIAAQTTHYTSRGVQVVRDTDATPTTPDYADTSGYQRASDETNY
ncbi:MAG: hypothetical protein J0I47_02025 [Sphingomonas sp.]|uniref:hypothetical protein n=1 Tax=Sphingomonas sp. TaxID=28214 RepID=UPI001AC6AB9A|nr:hypothetical protein [Sphingomonas sp.]MBN8807006.1 hypothetical protein [Sphingomonas sp.]